MERKRSRFIIRFVALATLATAALVIIGWFMGLEGLKRISLMYNSMKFNTAVCFFLLGVVLLLKSQTDNGRNRIADLLLIVILLITGVSLLENAFHYNTGIDQLIVNDPNTIPGTLPGRMAASTLWSFLLLCSALLMGNSTNPRMLRFSQFLLHFVTLAAFIILIGYLYDLPRFYNQSFRISMALHSATLFLLLSVAASCFHPTVGLTGLFSGKEIGNIMARRLFPLVIITLLSLGYLRLLSEQMQWINLQLGIALFACSFLMVCLLLIVNTAKHLNKIDSKRDSAEEALKALNKNLEATVAERTKDLEASEGKFHTIFRMSPVGLVISDLKTGTFIETNQSFEDFTGFSMAETEGKNTIEVGLITREERERVQVLLMEKGYLKNEETKYTTKSGEVRDMLMSMELIELGGQRIILTAMYDITHQKIAERELREAKRTAEESSLAKERFMANMSHEIRTPMNAIIGFTDLIGKTALDEQQSEYLRHIKTSGDNLLVLINDILDYAKIEAGMMQLEQIPFNLPDLAESITQLFSERASEKGLSLVLESDATIPPVLTGDPTRLTQILVNLLGNAFKFTEKGNVTLATKLLNASGQQVQISITVSDTGIGIPSEKQQEIFERFKQASEETTRTHGGTGLGLSIVKNLVELQHGQISVESEPGKGTTFTLNLPYGIGTEGTNTSSVNSHTEIKPFIRERKILLVEDNTLNQVLGKNVLSQFGCSAEIAANGAIALEMLQQQSYDLVLMDIQMPVMDGYTSAQTMRSELHATLPIIAMTAHVMAGEREKCISFGMNDYLSKPFKTEELYRMIARYTTD